MSACSQVGVRREGKSLESVNIPGARVSCWLISLPMLGLQLWRGQVLEVAMVTNILLCVLNTENLCRMDLACCWAWSFACLVTADMD